MILGLTFISCFILALILSFYLYKVRNTQLSNLLLPMTLFLAFWIFMEAISFYIKINAMGLFFQKAKYIGVCFVPPLFLLATLEFVKKPKAFTIFNKIMLFLVPFLSLLSIFTDIFPYKFWSSLQIDYQNGIPFFIYEKNIGFMIHSIYSYILTICACYLLFIHALNSPKLYIKKNTFVFAGSTLSFILNILFVTEVTGKLPIDTTPISILITLVVFYFGIYQLPKSVITRFARDLTIETIKDFVIIIDNSDCIIDANPAAVDFIQTHGNNKKNINFNNNLKGVKLSDALEYVPTLKTIKSASTVSEESTVIFKCSHKTFYFSVYESPIYDVKKIKIGKLYVFHNITQLQENLNNLEHLNEELLLSDRIINDTLEGVTITDAHGTIIRVNKAFEKMSGYPKTELIGSNPRILKSNRHDPKFYKDMWYDLKSKGYWSGEIWDRKKTGEIYPKWMSISSMHNVTGEVSHYIGISSDMTKIKKVESDLKYLAYYDSLTGIPNRTLFYEKLERALARTKKNESTLALLLMDLDRFNVINDSLGHAAGDLLLIEVAKRIKTLIGESDTVSRLGGDEFAIILDNIKSIDDVKAIANNILHNTSKPCFINDKEVSVGISIGIAIAPMDESTVEGMVRKADAAMYYAKETGRGKFSFYSEEIERRTKDVLEMQIKLRTALAKNEFSLYLQPQMAFNGRNFEIVGAEALIRWITTDGVIYTPDKFIPVAESNGMITSIGNWVLEEIFRIDKLLKENDINLKLAINVSVKQFENNNFVENLKRVLKGNHNQSINLVIEITESMFIHDIQNAIEALLEIKKLGAQIALDDFGTGFSSLSYLTRLPIDYLKIDKSFVDNIGSTEHKDLTSSIISMAKTLGVKTVAEGVETKEQIEKLIVDGGTELQGYYFSKPLAFEEFIKFAKKN